MPQSGADCKRCQGNKLSWGGAHPPGREDFQTETAQKRERPCGRSLDDLLQLSFDDYMAEPEAAFCILTSTFSVRPA
jgi:hypothetical protein